MGCVYVCVFGVSLVYVCVFGVGYVYVCVFGVSLVYLTYVTHSNNMSYKSLNRISPWVIIRGKMSKLVLEINNYFNCNFFVCTFL